MNDVIKAAIEELRLYRGKLYDTGIALCQAMGENVYTLDFLLIAALNRSLCLLRGFCDLMGSSNFVAAAPLVRLQLDNCLRVAAVAWVADPHAFASDILGGKPVRDMKDASGHPMTDNYLCNKLAQDFPWVRDVYDETSGFIHLSEKHVFNALTIDSVENRTVFLKVSERDEFVPDSAYIEAIETFGRITELFLGLVHAWIPARTNLSKATNG